MKRGRDWHYDNEDGGGIGTIENVKQHTPNKKLSVWVKWDCQAESYYEMFRKFALDLA